LIAVGAGFVVMIFPAMAASSGQEVSPNWLLLTYLLHTVGELCLSPVGLSSMTKLAPARVAGLMMGVWFLAASVGNFFGGRLASFYEAWSLPGLFGGVAVIGIVSGLIMLAFSRPIKRLMGEVR
jgi:POT family proton-dependent oligopeptide transporter